MLINPSQHGKGKASFPTGKYWQIYLENKKNTNVYIQTAPKKWLYFYYLKQGF